MTIEQCYKEMGANYDEVLQRLVSPRLIQKFVLKFLEDSSFERLKGFLEAENYPEAFRAAHTLKGVAQNLGFVKLYESSAELTEALRGGTLKGQEALFPPVAETYEETVKAVRLFQKGIGEGEALE